MDTRISCWSFWKGESTEFRFNFPKLSYQLNEFSIKNKLEGTKLEPEKGWGIYRWPEGLHSARLCARLISLSSQTKFWVRLRGDPTPRWIHPGTQFQFPKSPYLWNFPGSRSPDRLKSKQVLLKNTPLVVLEYGFHARSQTLTRKFGYFIYDAFRWNNNV